MIKIILPVLIGLLLHFNLYAQVIRNTSPVKKNTEIKTQPINPKIQHVPSASTAVVLNSTLHFANRTLTDPDCKGPKCYYWQYSTSMLKEYSNNPKSRNWEEQVMWARIPKGAAYGKYEISSSPFTNTANDAILQTGLIETHGKDSVLFVISYTDAVYKASLKPHPGKATQPVPKIGKKEVVITSNQLNLHNLFDKNLANNVFFIRITALDAVKNPLQNHSNSITLTKRWFEKFSTPVKKPEIDDDYSITSIKYIPVHTPDPNFYNCSIVTGYNESFFDNTPYGKNFAESFRKKFPIGSTICPDYSKDDGAWYEKAFNGVIGFAKMVINGAADFYNDTKNYVKNNIASTICSASPSNLKSACKGAAGFAFDQAMLAVGIPPSLPNTDDLTKMAEGQIVDLACDKIEEESGAPVPNVVREQVKKEFNSQVQSSIDQGMVDAGFLRVKPHPNGFFQTAYLQIEITRTGNSFKKKAIAGFSIDNICVRNNMPCQDCHPGGTVSKVASYNLFEQAYAEVPFLENIGDKTTIFVVLKPQESWIQWDRLSKNIIDISRGYPINDWFTPVEPTYEGAANSPGFQLLSTQSDIKFEFRGFKIANGVTTQFHHL